MAESRELEAFRIAIALTEGGGKIDYNQVNSATGAYGAYQFLPGDDWDWYRSKVPGMQDANIEDPRVQDAVALWHFRNNYNDLGSWELAAIAHFYGRTTAFNAKKYGIDSIKDKTDATGVSVEKYINIAMDYFKKQKQLYAKVDKDVAAMNLPDYGQAGFGGQFKPENVVSKEAATVLDVITNAMSDNGRKKFPMNTKSDFNSQVPKAAGDMEKVSYQTRINRLKESIK